MQVLPPGLELLHKLPFGRLVVEVGKVELAGDYAPLPKLLRLKFFGEDEICQQTCREQQSVEYKVHCSLWHFHRYLCEGENLKIEVLSEQGGRQTSFGEASVFLPLLLPRVLDTNLNNLVDMPTEHRYGIFRSDDSPPFGSR